MEIAQQPPIVHTAYNPVVLKLTDSSATSQSITINAGTPITMQRYPLNNSVLFEISTILKNLFENTITTSTLSDQIQIDHNLFVNYTLTAGGQSLIAEKTSLMTGSDLKTISASWTIEKTGVTVTAYFGDDGEIYFDVADPNPYLDSNKKIKLSTSVLNLTAQIGITGNTKEFDPYKAGDSIMTDSDLKTVGASWTADNIGLKFDPTIYNSDGSSTVATEDKFVLSVYDESPSLDPVSISPTEFISIGSGNVGSGAYTGTLGGTIGYYKFHDQQVTNYAFSSTTDTPSTSITITTFRSSRFYGNVKFFLYERPIDNGIFTFNSGTITIHKPDGTSEVITITSNMVTSVNSGVALFFNIPYDCTSTGNGTWSIDYSVNFSCTASGNDTAYYFIEDNVHNSEGNIGFSVNAQNISFPGSVYYRMDILTSSYVRLYSFNLNKTVVASDNYYKFSLDFEDIFAAIPSQQLIFHIFKIGASDVQTLIATTTAYYVNDNNFLTPSTRTYNGRPFYTIAPNTQFTISSAPTVENSIQYYDTASFQTIQYIISAYNADTAVEIATATLVYIYDPTFVNPTTRTYNGRPFYTITQTFTAINAVAQLAESSDLTSRRGTFLTQLDRLLLYPGYPRQVSCLGFKDGTYVNLSGMPLNPDNQTPLTPTLFNILLTDGNDYVALSNQYPDHYLQAGTGEIITTNDRGEIITIALPATGYTEHRLSIQNTCTPINPYYVRWINRQGGYDYWMFSFRQTIKEKIKITDTYNHVVYNPLTADAFSRTLGVEGTATITVGASGLTDNEYQAVSKIIYSPRIQYFDTDKSVWIALSISDSDVEKDTYASTQEIEITFLLPTPQVQF